MIVTDYAYLNDSAFLAYVDNLQSKDLDIKVVLLDWNENPIQEIQGYINGGSVTLDSKSAMRRGGSISIAIPDSSVSEFSNPSNLFSINKKIYLEVGLVNETKLYPEYDILWFPIGTFVISNGSFIHSKENLSMNLSIKDKMSLMNGECGGRIPASTQFDTYEIVDAQGNYYIEKPLIAQIIREVANHWGGEQLGKIVVSDVDSRIKMVMRWLGSTPLYMYGSGSNIQMTTSIDTAQAAGTYTTYVYGSDVGYIYTDFTYPGELIENAGGTAVSVLDKIKGTLGNYEYFYDQYGTFIFQEIKNYLNTTEATTALSEMLTNADYSVDMSGGREAYDFTDSKLISSFSNNPQYTLIKNDFVIWGIRKGATGTSLAIRYHLAIDKKPTIGNIYEVFFYEDPEDSLVKAKATIDYTNLEALEANTGVSGYIYRTLDDGKLYTWGSEMYSEIEGGSLTKIKTTDWRSELYLEGVMAEPQGLESNYYYPELAAEWPKLYDLKKHEHADGYFTGDFHDTVLANPSAIDFFLDFIDTNSILGNYSVSSIGRRSHVESSNDVNCIFAPEIPDLIIIESGLDTTETDREEAVSKGQNFCQVSSDIYKNLAIGGISNDAYTVAKNLAYNAAVTGGSIQLQIVPIYYLQPNSIIKVQDAVSDISGEFLITSINVPFTQNGTMSVSAVPLSVKY